MREEPSQSSDDTSAGVPTDCVRLLQSVKLLPHQGATVAVQVEDGHHSKRAQTLLLEPDKDASLQVQDSLL